MSRSRPPYGRTSVGSGVVLMAVGAVLAFAVEVPAAVEEYVDVLDLGLILVWAGVLVLVMQVVMNLSDRVVVLHHGQELAVGPPREVVENPAVVEAYLGTEYRDAHGL